MRCLLTAVLFLWTSATILASEQDYRVEEVTYSKEHNLKGYLTRPKGNSPFPVAVYHHGGLGPHIGGSPKETSLALAEAGYIGFSPIRRKTAPMADAIEDANAAMSFIDALPDADKTKIAILGFSRGGHLAVYSGAGNTNVKAMILMACAPGRRGQEEFLSRVRDVQAPVLLLVAENDNRQVDHVALAYKIKKTLDEAQKDSKLIVYPRYKEDGHEMFFEIGSYWRDVVAFLDEKMKVDNKTMDSDKK